MKNFHKILVIFSLTFFACASSQSGPAIEKYKSFVLQKTHEPLAGLQVYEYLHEPSGLRVFLTPKSGSQAIAFVTAYHVGSRFEVAGRTGLAHLFEHMMFRGTENFPEPFKTLSTWGDSYNAFTSNDVTLYHEVVPNSYFKDLVKFESERMRGLKLTPEVFMTERGAVVSERKMRTEDSPFGRMYWELYQAAFDVHPYKTGPIGWQEDLDATTYDDALAFYKKYYAPNRATISIGGDFSLKEALELLDKYYGSFKKENFEMPPIAQEPARKDKRRKVIGLKSESVMIADAILGLRFEDNDVAAQSLFCSLLTDSRIGYLPNELVEKNIARSVSSDCSPNMDPGLDTIFVVGNPGLKVDKVENAYDKAMQGFAKWLTEDRVEKAKKYYLASQWSTLRDPAQFTQQIALEHAISGNPFYEVNFLEKVKTLKKADLLARYERWKKSASTRIIISPAAKNPPFKKPAAKSAANKGA